MRTAIIMVIMAFMFTSARPATPEVPAQPVPEAVGGIAVQTDYSGLTEYTPPGTATRLVPGPMPELVPSDNYGLLVPYIGNHGNYGLATMDGVLVTDAVYTWAYLDNKQNVYHLAGVKPDGSENAYYGACAADGSWYIPVQYSSIIVHDSVISAIRTHRWPDSDDSYDIDVYDHSGRVLYNLLDLPYADMLDRDSPYTPYTSADVVPVKLVTGEAAYLDLPAGALTITEFEEVLWFSEGLAPVCLGGLWGYIDESFALVIEPKYSWAFDFIDGHAIVLREDGLYNAVIDKTGAEIFGVEGYAEPMNLSRNGYDYEGYVLRKSDDYSAVAYFTRDFQSVPVEIDGEAVEYRGGGWYSYRRPGGAMLISPDNVQYELPGEVYNIDRVYGELVVYSNAGNNYGIMTLSGEDVIPLREDHYYIYKFENLDLFCVYTDGGMALYRPDGSMLSFVPRSTDINMIDSAYGLLGVTTRDSFYYLDENGDVAFRVSRLAYVPD